MEETTSTTPRWNHERPFLTGQFYRDAKPPPRTSGSKSVASESYRGSDIAIGSYPVAVQELLIVDDMLSALVGIEGRFISIRKERGTEDHFIFQIVPSTDLALRELAQRMFPLCENYILIDQFIEAKSHFKNGLVNQAFAAALRALLLDYQTMVAQLEHQFRLGRLSVQGLWFFCQPMIGSMHALSTVIKQISTDDLSGAATLNLLQNQARAMAGDCAVRTLLEKMTECASTPYLRILERWVYEGVIEDPYGEFFISEDKSFMKESLTQDYEAKYWKKRYSLKDSIPSFLSAVAGTVLTTGKYLNVMRECGHNVQVPVTENSKFMSFESNHHYLECIKSAHDFASKELLNLIKDKYDFFGKLRSMKHYLLLDQGDFLVHFMDISRDELAKRPEEINVEKLQSLLELALRTTAAAADPCHEDLACSVEKDSLLKKLATVKGLDPDGQLSAATSDDSVDQMEPLSITGLETFSLSYKVQWPLSIIISRKVLAKYQLIFRFLFHCKHVSRQLCVAWQVHQGARALCTAGTAISRSSVLCRSMLKFINSVMHYLTFDVLEPNWHVMYSRLQSAKSIDEVIQYHDFFLDKCLRECLLLLPHLLKKIERLKSLCLQYSAAVKHLVPTISDPEKSNLGRRRRPALTPAVDGTRLLESTLRFEREFNRELQSLGPALSGTSRAEPFLTHLAQCLDPPPG
ncbi:spc97 / Spc98 family of spindle pole body (SBP) component [Wolffia australiana]